MKINLKDKDILVDKDFYLEEIPDKQRKAVFENLFFNFKKENKVSFWLMLILSSGIATLGLSENSTATVIGAMIVAPLGQPIIAFGGAITLGWSNEAFKMCWIILVGTMVVIAVSYGLGTLLKIENPSNEILSRTSPDLRDLGIAVFAGAVGAYGYFRSEYSSVLAGVAIAVALVPPLCACGLMLESGKYVLANGGFLLFITNLIGIAFASILMFLISGIKHNRNLKWFYSGTVGVIIAGLTIVIPLTINYNRAFSRSKVEREIYADAIRILTKNHSKVYIDNISIQGSEAIIKIHPFPDSQIEIESIENEIQKITDLQILLQPTDSYNK
jgi:uncharacterized hydrophobic protein (TIGR00271 family)